MSKIWFITGSSRGFGRQFAEAALRRGDKVAATARNTKALADLAERFGDAVLPLQLDVTDRPQVFEAVAAATERFGRLDVVVNNAGYSLIGAVEDLGEQELRDQLETNVFGVFHVTQAVLPVLRAQGSGHIVQISSAMGVATFGGTGGYSASKWALEGMSEALSQEVAPFGIKVTLIEPGAFATDFASSAVFTAHGQDAYGPLYASLTEMGASAQAPDPEGVGAAILKIVDAEEPPLRVFFGEQPTQWIPAVYQQRLDTWAEWAHVSKAAEGN
ncbi:SDR family NAD(P)-dependent oxidoreductase [Streptomyces sp. NPDC101776]|uniref:SDR family NAD(P)-dependent oxidoreductase n=1 Tax=Streptomyces sp. NPDC101776 TaxID=3366146 RepID=UPI00382A7E78